MSSYTKSRIEACFRAKNYRMILSNISGVVVYVKETAKQKRAVVVYDIFLNPDLEPQQYQHVLQDVFEKLSPPESEANQIKKPLSILSLLHTNDLKQVKPYIGAEFPTWILSEDVLQLIIYEDQIQNYDGLRELFERVYDPDFKVRKAKEPKEKKEVMVVTTILFALNIIIYSLGTMLNNGMTYDKMVRYGSLYWHDIVYKGEVYRFLTSIFLHGDVSHLFNNMILLFSMGKYIEKYLGKLRYIILYFSAGILAGGFSVGYNIWLNRDASSIGASGAIMGLVGAFAYILIRNRGKVEDISLSQIIFFVILSILNGVTTSGIDNMAHIGGLISGFLLCMLLYQKKQKKTFHQVRGQEETKIED